MSGQKKRHSLLEVCLNTAIGFVIAILTQIVVFEGYNMSVTFGQQLEIGLIFTVVSIVRSYGLRRLFNYVHVRGWL